MTHPARPQIALAKNSKRSSRRNRLVARGSELFAVSQESPFLLCKLAEVSLPWPASPVSTFTNGLLCLQPI